MKKSEKTFDCIAYKRAAQLQIYEEIKEMSRQEEMAYFHNKAETGSLRDWWLRQKSHEAHVCSCAENGTLPGKVDISIEKGKTHAEIK